MNARKDETGKPVTVRDIRQAKGGQPIVGLAAYTTPIARLVDPHADFILVGDSLGMTVYGLDSTLQVSVEMMIAHGQAVRRGTSHACVVVDLPFGSYQESPQQAFRTASDVLARTNAAAVKLEGGAEMAETVDFLARRGVPVLGHVGLMPQSVNAYGGYRARGRHEDEAARIKSDAAAIAEAGAFAVVIEGVVEPLGRAVTEALAVPTIGIGASPACDGQILVVNDMLGLGAGKPPRFVKQYAELNRDIETAVAAFAEDVRARRFPGPEHCYGVS